MPAQYWRLSGFKVDGVGTMTSAEIQLWTLTANVSNGITPTGTAPDNGGTLANLVDATHSTTASWLNSTASSMTLTWDLGSAQDIFGVKLSPGIFAAGGSIAGFTVTSADDSSFTINVVQRAQFTKVAYLGNNNYTAILPVDESQDMATYTPKRPVIAPTSIPIVSNINSIHYLNR